MRPAHFVALNTLALSGIAAGVGPIAHWRFDEAGGLTAADSAGAFHGTLVGGAAFEPGSGIDGGAIHLRRLNNGHVRIGHVLGMEGDARFTIAAWVRTDSTSPEQVVIGRYVAGGPGGYLLAINQSSGGYGAPQRAWFYGSRPPGYEPISTTPVSDGSWRHVVVTRQLGLVRIFVDGAPAEDQSPSFPIPTTTAPLLIGGLRAGPTEVGEFEGLLDDIQIYNRVLSDADIDFLFANPGSTVAVGCPPDITHGASPGAPGYGLPDCSLNNDDYFYYLIEFSAANLAVCDLTTTAVQGQPGYGIPDGVINNDDFFYYLILFSAGC